MTYLSLEERKRRLIESCLGCGGGGADNFASEPPMGADDTPADMSEVPPERKKKAAKLDLAMNRINKKKRKVM